METNNDNLVLAIVDFILTDPDVTDYTIRCEFGLGSPDAADDLLDSAIATARTMA